MLGNLSTWAAAQKTLKRSKNADGLFDQDQADTKLVVALTPIYEDHMTDAGRNAALMVDFVGFDPNAESLLRWIEFRAKRIAGDIDKETAKQLLTSLEEGMAEGETLEELTARVEAVYGAAAGYRAERIARTESIRSATEAAIEAWNQSGVVSGKEWFTAKDDRVCPFCEPMDGTVVGLDTSYFNIGDIHTVPQLDASGNPVTDDSGSPVFTSLNISFEDIEGPPLHVSCRCALLPVLQSD